MKTALAALACAACACLLTPAFALADGDGAATRAYLRADYAYDRSVEGRAAAIAAATEARASAIAGECPSALTYAPRDLAFGELGEEASWTLFSAGAVPLRSARLRFADAIARLHWSDRRLTRLVHAEAAEERAIATLALPDVCADIAGWQQSAYAALPQSAMQFLARAHAIDALSFVGFTEESRDGIIMRLLERYERSAERRSVKRAERLEARVGGRLEKTMAVDGTKLASALGVSTL